LNGKAILYADKLTGSIERAIATTLERRQIQTEFNILHGITPKGIKKAVMDVMEGASQSPGFSRRGAGPQRKLADHFAEITTLPEIEDKATLQQKIATLQDKMQEHARNLEFEEAAYLRDVIGKLRIQLLQL
jgi:excinuclease ABC subunit B